MHTIADTKMLVDEGVISHAAARIIEARARNAMVALAINILLCAGILFATFGLIFWLADAAAVAVFGAVMAGGGVLTLRYGRDLYAMFGNAAILIGAGMLMGGMGFELIEKFPDVAGAAMALTGAIVTAAAGWIMVKTRVQQRFVTGAIMLMAVALHLVGLVQLLEHASVTGLLITAFWLYAAGMIAAAGWVCDVRLVSALAIAPFAQALDTGTFYFHAAYVFYSPESTLSILQMTALILAMLWVARNAGERTARHARIHVMMGFVVANLCALVGSLWGDVVGQTMWGPGTSAYRSGLTYDGWQDAMVQFRAATLDIHEHVYSVLWAAALAVIISVAAHKNMRGLFNAAVTFAGIHGYTQAFETFYDEPLAYVIAGLTAIPLAWGLWRLNVWFLSRTEAVN